MLCADKLDVCLNRSGPSLLFSFLEDFSPTNLVERFCNKNKKQKNKEKTILYPCM